MNKILIIEDEADLAQVLDDYLKHHHFDTAIVSDGARAMATLEEFQPDFILLDLRLPNKDGLSLCREIRSVSHVPIIMVTAKVEEIDRLLGLELGADDYICKPYSPREVVARVNANLRRVQFDQGSPATEHNALLLDEDAMAATLHGNELNLTAVEFRLLSALSAEPKRVFTRDQLMDRIYRDQRVVNDRTIDSHITKLRKKLTAANAGSEVVRSVYGVGYKFEMPAK
ncbi:MAG: response regulator [Ketobacter sp.]